MGSRNRQPIALISIHGDPDVDIGREEAGGQNVYVRQVGEALAKLGWQVDMFTRKIHANQPTIVQHSPYCRTIRLSAGPLEYIPRDELFEYLPEFVTAFQNFQAKEGTNYPLVHTNYWLSAWVGLQLKKHHNVQLVHTYHSLGKVKYQAVSHRPSIADTRLAIEQQILEQSNTVIATSPQEEEVLRYLVSQNGHISVIPCGTNLENFHVISKPEARLKLGLDPQKPIILYVGRFDPRKGIETLVRACHQYQTTTNASFKLIIAGGSDPNKTDGQERQRIEDLVNELGLTEQTCFPGQLSHDILPLYYAAADVCVVPSHYEPFGLVAIEAMACGTPVIASNVGGLKFTVIPEETGLLVPPQDINGFADAINRILTDDVWTQKLRKQASVRVSENFSWVGVAIRLSDLYRRILAESIMDERLLPLSRSITASEITTIPVTNPTRKVS
ncbi:glycosyltransferase family 4 protein [Planktothrix serta]|uniref:glycosyltransferase family 4 protein n=1 Tax=Planktothrix serta TaxID=1678310 RepID=UPI0009FAF630